MPESLIIKLHKERVETYIIPILDTILYILLLYSTMEFIYYIVTQNYSFKRLNPILLEGIK